MVIVSSPLQVEFCRGNSSGLQAKELSSERASERTNERMNEQIKEKIGQILTIRRINFLHISYARPSLAIQLVALDERPIHLASSRRAGLGTL